jgi:hypothetical protein
LDCNIFKNSILITCYHAQKEKNYYIEDNEDEEQLYSLGYFRYKNIDMFILYYEYPSIYLKNKTKLLFLYFNIPGGKHSYIINLNTCIEQHTDHELISRTVFDKGIFNFSHKEVDGYKFEINYFINQKGEIEIDNLP